MVICNAASIDPIREMSEIYRCEFRIAYRMHDADGCLKHADLCMHIDGPPFERGNGSPSHLATAQMNLGIAYSMKGRYGEAIEKLKESKKMMGEIPGFRRDELFEISYHLAITYFSRGQYDEARDVLYNALDVHKYDPQSRLLTR